MLTDNQPAEIVPNLGFAEKTLDDLYLKVGYIPDPKISGSLSEPDFGFFSKDHSPEK